MKPHARMLSASFIGIVCVGASASGASDRMVGLVRPDGVTALVKRFDVAVATTIIGAQFENNDLSTTFPEIALIHGPMSSMSEGELVDSIGNVNETSPGMVTVLWPTPIVAAEEDEYYVVIRLPVGSRRTGPGIGAGVGADDVAEPNGSFIGSPEGPLFPIGVDLAVTLLTGGIGRGSKAGLGDPAESVTPAHRQDFFRLVGSNPTGGSSRIEFGLERSTDVTIDVYNAAGRRVRRLIDGVLSAGVHQREWNGHDTAGTRAAAGVYFIVLGAREKVTRVKVVLTK